MPKDKYSKSCEHMGTDCSRPLPKPNSIEKLVWDHLKIVTNVFQLSFIQKVMSGKFKESIILLQGPPGTGKTMTIVSLVTALLNGNAPASGSRNQGTLVKVGKAFTSNSGKPVNAVVSRRILVCAPSNQTVDELAWKLHKNALGPSGKKGDFNMIRFGIIPGENRHDGRGNRSKRHGKIMNESEKDKFLSSINLDYLVRDIAEGREIHDFAFAYHDRCIKNCTKSKSKNSKFINYSAEREKILTQCHVVCTTLSGAGSKAFIEAASREDFPQSEFDAVIIDEACQGSEMSCLIPFKFNPNIVCLVGDPNQLPVTSLSPDASRCNADRSLFERLHSNGWPNNMLKMQYRMHPGIVSFPSRMFYDSSLISCENVQNQRDALWHDHIAFPPYLLWNIQGSAMYRGVNGGISNFAETLFVEKLLLNFSKQFPTLRNVNIGIISFYSDQVSGIKNRLTDPDLLGWLQSKKITLEVSTVDGFQGCEKDIIILSCVRSRWAGKRRGSPKSNIGFLKDFRRVNVALTRAKFSLWVIADCEALSHDALWDDLINDARKRKVIANHRSLSKLLGSTAMKRTKQKQKRSKK